MIQRKQTLFLLIVAIVAIINLFIPFIGFTRSNESFTLNLSEGIRLTSIKSNIFYPFTLTILSISLSVITIFLYKNRVLQYKLANVLVLLAVFTTGLFFLLDFVNIDHTDLYFTFGSFLPIVSAIFAYLAAYFIKKDEQLVRSADRIR